MADRKFRVIKERPLAVLSEEQLKKWEALLLRRERLYDAHTRYKRAFQKFVNKVDATLTRDAQDKKLSRGIRIDETGLVWQVYCECPICQADLQALPVAFVAEEMIQQLLVNPADIPDLRKKVDEIETKKRAELTKKKWIN